MDTASNSMPTSLEMRPARPDDAPLFAAWWQEPSIRRYQPVDERSLEEIRQSLDEISDPRLLRFGHGCRFRWVLELDRQPIGWLSLIVANWDSCTGEIAYSLSTPFQGRGLMKRAIMSWLDSTLAATKIQRLEAFCVTANLASCRMIEQCGFRLEKEIASYVTLGDERFDCRLYAAHHRAPEVRERQKCRQK